MRMILHSVSDYIRDFVESSIVLFVQRVEYSPLDRLQSILELGNCSIANDVRGVLKKIIVYEVLQRIFGQMQLCGFRRHRRSSDNRFAASDGFAFGNS